jgi:hypothetical protein
MKKIHIVSILVFAVITVVLFSFKPAQQDPASVYQYKQFSTVESIIPGGLGRSRLITTDDAGSTVEKDLKNFYSLAGINFSNITNNDVVIVDRINMMSKEGWDLISVTAGVQSPNENNSGGIFITRYLFRKPAQQ